jgi:hypothetical protein
MVTFLKETGISVEPMHVAVWGMPTALAAFLVHGFRLYRLDASIAKQIGETRVDEVGEGGQDRRDVGVSPVASLDSGGGVGHDGALEKALKPMGEKA